MIANCIHFFGHFICMIVLLLIVHHRGQKLYIKHHCTALVEELGASIGGLASVLPIVGRIDCYDVDVDTSLCGRKT
jgi:hypothetical protein